VVDVRTNQVLLRVRGGATGLWSAEHLFDRTGTPYLASGWRFCQRHDIMAGHFLVFNYDATTRLWSPSSMRKCVVGTRSCLPTKRPPFPPPLRMTSSHGLLFIQF
jgi:hypothetical protein